MVDPLRIRSTWLKVVCVAVYVLAATTTGRLLAEGNVTGVPATLILNAVWIAALVTGARTFRVHEEDPIPPRPWWQLTGRPTAGFVIAGLLVGSELFLWASAALGLTPVDVASSILNSAFTLTVAALYVRSSLLLKR
jgi:hypothetical protein